jgi:hypothetical protein
MASTTFVSGTTIASAWLNDVNGITYGTGTNGPYATPTAWTPVFIGTVSNPTIAYSVQTGFYTRMGKMIFLSFHLGITTTSGGSGGLRISGLPFTIGSITHGSAHTPYAAGFGTQVTGGLILTSETAIRLYTGGNTLAQTSTLANGAELYGTGTYWVD